VGPLPELGRLNSPPLGYSRASLNTQNYFTASKFPLLCGPWTSGGVSMVFVFDGAL
jgi:hypothetical protein